MRWLSCGIARLQNRRWRRNFSRASTRLKSRRSVASGKGQGGEVHALDQPERGGIFARLVAGRPQGVVTAVALVVVHAHLTLRFNRPTPVGPCLQYCARRMQGNSPRLVADNPVLRDAAPGLKRHNGGFRVRPEIAVDPLRRCVRLPRRAVGEQYLQANDDRSSRALLQRWHRPSPRSWADDLADREPYAPGNCLTAVSKRRCEHAVIRA
jgi:hypothetical protein